MRDGTGCGVVVYLAIVVGSLIGWITHLVVCFREGEWGFLVAGAIFFPVAVIHGWGRILGVW